MAGRKPGSYKWYELQDPVVPLAKSRAPRLFYQDIQTAPACCLDPDRRARPRHDRVDLAVVRIAFLLALLNSPLYAWYARRRFPPALNGAVRPKLEYMRALPIATPTPAVRKKIATLVTRQLSNDLLIGDPAIDRELAELINVTYELRPSDIVRLSSL